VYTKTFEVLSKYISGEYGVKVNFDNPNGAKANIKTNVISMPDNISGDNALGALALLMHEAAHLKYTKEIPMDKVIKTPTEKHILNVIEDIRIDEKNFYILPNVKEFYRQLYKKLPPVETTDRPLSHKALIASIDAAEGFRHKFSPEIEKILYKEGLLNDVQNGVHHGNYGDYDKLRETIQDIKKKLKLDDSKEKPLEFEKVKLPGGGTATIVKEGDEGEAEGFELSELGGEDRKAGIKWGEGTAMKGPRSDGIGETALEEQTIQNFKELLSIKEKRVIDDGRVLDTDNLMAYFTGDIEELFKDECTVKQKKSKIMFLLDCSGSMSCNTISADHSYADRTDVVESCVQKIMDIIEEVRSSESLDVDYDIAMFDGQYFPLTKENWKEKYGAHGGTDFVNGMARAIEQLMTDYTVEGKRIIVAFTDGEVGDWQIDEVCKLMSKTGADCRFLLIAVGTTPGSSMSTKLVGDRIIMGPDDANTVLLETLKDLIE